MPLDKYVQSNIYDVILKGNTAKYCLLVCWLLNGKSKSGTLKNFQCVQLSACVAFPRSKGNFYYINAQITEQPE